MRCMKLRATCDSRHAESLRGIGRDAEPCRYPRVIGRVAGGRRVIGCDAEPRRVIGRVAEDRRVIGRVAVQARPVIGRVVERVSEEARLAEVRRLINRATRVADEDVRRVNGHRVKSRRAIGHGGSSDRNSSGRGALQEVRHTLILKAKLEDSSSHRSLRSMLRAGAFNTRLNGP
jgi:hypothetical protein